jgi:hypothetical protein
MSPFCESVAILSSGLTWKMEPSPQATSTPRAAPPLTEIAER